MEEEFYRTRTPFIILLIIGVSFIAISNMVLNNPLDYETYIFEFYSWGDENMIFNCFNLNYDFTLNEGSIHFKTNNNIQNLSIEFPGLTRISKLEINPNQSFINETLHRKNSILFIRNLSKEDDGYEINIYFQSDMHPNAHFQLYKASENFVIYDGCGTAINFSLGDKYSCIGRCLVLLGGVEERISSSQDEIQLGFEHDTGGNINYDNHRFRIEARQDYVIFLREYELLFGLGVSFISAALVGLIVIFSRRKK